MSLNEEERRIMREKSDSNCAFDATQDVVEPLIEPTRQLITDLERIYS